MKQEGRGYELLLEIGQGTGAEVSQLLELNVEDVVDKDYISLPVGPLQVVRTYVLPEALKERLEAYTNGKQGRLFTNPDGSPITEAEAAEFLASQGITEPFLVSVLKRYYQQTGDIYYPMHMMQIQSEAEAEELLA